MQRVKKNFLVNLWHFLICVENTAGSKILVYQTLLQVSQSFVLLLIHCDISSLANRYISRLFVKYIFTYIGHLETQFCRYDRNYNSLFNLDSQIWTDYCFCEEIKGNVLDFMFFNNLKLS